MELFAPGTVIASRYRVLRELGRGGMGVVFLVEHVNTGQELALKVISHAASLSKDAVERFKREARAPARIKSEHVVMVTDADVLPELGGAPFFVMERLEGRDLDAEVAARGKLPPAEIVMLLAQAAGALDRLHEIGIIHRDLKPENLFLHRRRDGSVCLKLLDFGISKVVDAEGGVRAASLTGPGSLLGTPLYMSPEQATDGAPLTRATDVWSLGLIVIRLLTGEFYWTSTSIGELMLALLRDPMPAPSVRWNFLPSSFDAWFARSCDRDASKRFASVGQQLEALARVFGEVGAWERMTVHAVEGAPAPSSPAAETLLGDSKSALTVTPGPRRRPSQIVAVGAGVVVALGTLIAFTSRRAPVESKPDVPSLVEAPDAAPATATREILGVLPSASVSTAPANSGPGKLRAAPAAIKPHPAPRPSPTHDPVAP